MSINVTSPRFEKGKPIPRKFTCDGDDISPLIRWDGLPKATVSVALLMDDPDAPNGTYTHWIVYNLPADSEGLEEIVPIQKNLDNGAIQGKNDFGKYGYGGPCPPQGETHRYFFKVFALDKKLDQEDGSDRGTLLQSIKGCIIDQGEYMGTYKRS